MKKNLKPRAIMYPAPTAIASAYDNKGNTDACTLAFATMCSHKPPCILIAINSTLKRKTLKSILKRKEFTIGFPSTKQVAEADYLGIETGYNTNKIEKINYTTKKAEKVNAPIFNEFKVSLECKLINTIDIGSHKQIFAEIVNIQAEEELIQSNGRINFKKLDPIIYDDVEYNYYQIGDKIADAFKIGQKFKQ